MSTVFLTGHSGFVGKNFINRFSDYYIIEKFIRNSFLQIDSNIVLHFAGKSHDLNNSLSYDDYLEGNFEFSKTIFNAFLESKALVFITLSSVKAVVDFANFPLKEETLANPSTTFGKSKLLVEQYILSKEIPVGKRVYVLRPCMIHGPGNKGNLNLLNKFVSKSFPWPLGAFDNKRSFCSIDNLLFIIKELIERDDIPSGIYNVADDEGLSTNEVISILAETKNKKPKICKIPKRLIHIIAKIGNIMKLPLNEERLQILTHSYLVSNFKIKAAIGKPLPFSSKEGFIKTFKSFD
uniref:NAD-dependent epimerase/dehydratase family protein n=1 Tax=Algoriphagus sp. TaxID=1872435 RepID=UPI0040479551